MKLLIIEDNHSKLNELKKFIKHNYPVGTIHDALSYTAGLRRIYDEEWDVILLDMSLPIYDMNQQDAGGDKKPVAGKEIMKRMLHKNIIVPTVVVTQFDTFGESGITIDSLNKEFENTMKEIWKGTVNYGNATWTNDLKSIMDSIVQESKKDEKNSYC